MQMASMPNAVALRWIGKSGDRRDITYCDLAGETSRFANALGMLGLGAGGACSCCWAGFPSSMPRCSAR